jgi:hypothetical protein
MEKKVILVTGGSGLVGKGIFLRIDIFSMFFLPVLIHIMHMMD